VQAKADPLVQLFAQHLAEPGLPTRMDVFSANMCVEIVNDGPVTIVLDRPPSAARS
jgi:D-aminoacyl-tRNA deacylase